jgi:hypothetical protein
MIVSHPIYGEEVNLRCAVYDTVADEWVEVLADSTLLTIERGGDPDVAGGSSVDVGTLSINLLDILDPMQVDMLKPNQDIIAYIDEQTYTDSLVDGAIFTGNIQDISTDYFFERGTKHVNVVILAVDAVSSHSDITVTNTDDEEGFTGEFRTTTPGTQVASTGYQRWEDRINELSTQFAKTPVPEVETGQPIIVYSI